MGIVASCVSSKNRKNRRREWESNTAPRHPEADVVRFPSYYVEGLGKQIHKRTDDCYSTLSESSSTLSARELEKGPDSAKEVEKGQLSTSSEIPESAGPSDESDVEERKTASRINVVNNDGSGKKNRLISMKDQGEHMCWRLDRDLDGPPQSFPSIEEERQSSKHIEGVISLGKSGSAKMEAVGEELTISASSTPKGTTQHQKPSYKMVQEPAKTFRVPLEQGMSKTSSFPVSSERESAPQLVTSPDPVGKKSCLPSRGLEEGLGQAPGSEAHRNLDFCLRIIFFESSSEWKVSFEGMLIRRGLEKRRGISLDVRC